jgi:hypothetical protein
MIRFTSVRFSHFKSLKAFSVSLQRTNVLVGPNNAGKSTILGAFRMLTEGLRRARAYRPQFVHEDGRDVLGYYVDLRDLPISTENVFTDYDDSVPARIVFRLSNGNELALSFPEVGVCILTCKAGDRLIRSPSEFAKAYPVSVGFVPVLGPVEHREQLFKKEAARLALLTHGASRNFRNIWYHYPDEFELFRSQIRDTWPGMDIERPSLQNDGTGARLVMFCPEKRYPREIYWAGFGFQVWCQMLTYMIRARQDTILIIDEPDIYLHSDLQRQLLTLLDGLGPDILIATHSTEIISETEPTNLLLIKKGASSAKRLTNNNELQRVFAVLGSNANPILTQVARSKRALFLEGKDFQVFSVLARKLGYPEVANRSDFAVVPVEGFDAHKAEDLARGFELALGSRVRKAVVFDRDYRAAGEVSEILTRLGKFAAFAHIHHRKELENYLLVPAALSATIIKRLAEQNQRAGLKLVFDDDIGTLLETLTSSMRHRVAAQYLARRVQYERSKNPSLEAATVTEAHMKQFEYDWASLETRLEIVPGKELISDLNVYLQSKYAISLSPLAIANNIASEHIPSDMRGLIEAIDAFRKQDVDES